MFANLIDFFDLNGRLVARRTFGCLLPETYAIPEERVVLGVPEVVFHYFQLRRPFYNFHEVKVP